MRRSTSEANVVLPLPVGPIMATKLPLPTSKLMSSSTMRSEEGYLKDTFLNDTVPASSGGSSFPSYIVGSYPMTSSIRADETMERDISRIMKLRMIIEFTIIPEYAVNMIISEKSSIWSMWDEPMMTDAPIRYMANVRKLLAPEAIPGMRDITVLRRMLLESISPFSVSNLSS